RNPSRKKTIAAANQLVTALARFVGTGAARRSASARSSPAESATNAAVGGGSGRTGAGGTAAGAAGAGSGAIPAPASLAASHRRQWVRPESFRHRQLLQSQPS